MKKKLIAMALIIAVMFTIIPTAGTTAEAAGKRPAKVTGVKVKQSGTKKLKITWKKAKYAKKYVVYQKKGAGKWKKVKTTKKRSYMTKNLSKNVIYEYRIKASNSREKSKKYSATKCGYTRNSSRYNIVIANGLNRGIYLKGVNANDRSVIEYQYNNEIKNNLSTTSDPRKNVVEIYPNGSTFDYLVNGLGPQREYEGYNTYRIWDIGTIKKGYTVTYTLGNGTATETPTVNSAKAQTGQRIQMNHHNNTIKLHVFKDNKLIALAYYTEGKLYNQNDTYYSWKRD